MMGCIHVRVEDCDCLSRRHHCCFEKMIRCRSCPHCGEAHFKYLSSAMTPGEFKKKFKVGNIIEVFATRKRYLITAIGERRFLAIDFHMRRESVLSMNTANDYKLSESQKISTEERRLLRETFS